MSVHDDYEPFTSEARVLLLNPDLLKVCPTFNELLELVGRYMKSINYDEAMSLEALTYIVYSNELLSNGFEHMKASLREAGWAGVDRVEDQVFGLIRERLALCYGEQYWTFRISSDC